jgi:hypothetical protein
LNLMHFHAVSPYASPTRLNPFGQRQPMEVNNMLIVSFETYDKTAAVSVRLSGENRHTAARSGERVESVVGRVWASVIGIGTPRV